jgi:predicted RNase H-like HicB family nuclease
MTYDYVSWKESGVWTAHCPAVPGVYGLGDTSAQAVADLREALNELDDYLDEIGESLPSAGKVRTGELRL